MVALYKPEASSFRKMRTRPNFGQHGRTAHYTISLSSKSNITWTPNVLHAEHFLAGVPMDATSSLRLLTGKAFRQTAGAPHSLLGSISACVETSEATTQSSQVDTRLCSTPRNGSMTDRNGTRMPILPPPVGLARSPRDNPRRQQRLGLLYLRCLECC